MIVLSPRLRHQHQQGVREVAASRDEKFEHIVERSRIALARRDERQDFRHIVSEELRGQKRFAGAQAVQVAAQRIDFAVMRQVAERVCEVPGRKRVRAVPLMDQRQRRFEVGVAEVGVKFFELRRQQQSLVDDAAAGHAADIRLGERLFDQPPHDEEFALERRTVRERLPADEKLADRGTAFARRAADLARHGRNLAPGDHPATFGSDDAFDIRLAPDAAEDHRHAVAAGFRQSGDRFAEEFIRHRKEQSGAVAGIRIAARRAAVHEPLQDGQPHRYNFVRRHVVEVGDHADAAGIVLVAEAVKPVVGNRRTVESPGRPVLLSLLFHEFSAPF